MLKSAQRKANAKGTQHASLFYDELPVGKLQDEKKLAAFFAFFCLSVLHALRTRSDMVLDHDANRSKLLLKLKWIRFLIIFFQFCGFYHCVSVLRKTLRISVEIRTNTGAWQHCYNNYQLKLLLLLTKVTHA